MSERHFLASIEKYNNENPHDQVTIRRRHVTSSMHVCAYCKQSNAKKRCAKCKSVNYCNAECQKAHWQTHKQDCDDTLVNIIDISKQAGLDIRHPVGMK